jgi:hypothetical protein
MFFLAGLTSVLGDIAIFAGGPFKFLLYVFAPDDGMAQMAGDSTLTSGMVRLGALPMAAASIYSWILARHGFRGAFELSKPWRLGLISLAMAACLASGYRSSLILFGLTVLFLFRFEGLHRTRVMPIMAGLSLLFGAIILPQADKLPLMAQRALSFVPAVPLNPLAKESAQASTEWRVEMWKQVLPQVPHYLLKGKGYALDPRDLFMAHLSAVHGFGIQAASAVVAGDYHNGPLSVIIPFGIFGMIGFAWVIVAGLRLLYYYSRFGDPELKRINTFLLAGFAAKLTFFVIVFGSLSSDLCTLLGMIGLAVSLNGAPQTEAEPETSAEPLTFVSERAY